MAGDGSARFPSTMRLKKKADFTRAFRAGSTWKGSCFSLHILVREGDNSQQEDRHPRLGVVVTRKVGTAVERNRIKRKLREAFRKSAGRLPAVDLVIRPNASCLEASESHIVRSLEGAVARVLENVKERT